MRRFTLGMISFNVMMIYGQDGVLIVQTFTIDGNSNEISVF